MLIACVLESQISLLLLSFRESIRLIMSAPPMENQQFQQVNNDSIGGGDDKERGGGE